MEGVRIRIHRDVLRLADQPIARTLRTITGMILLQVGILLLAMRGLDIRFDALSGLAVSLSFTVSAVYVFFKAFGVRPMTFLIGFVGMALILKLAIATDGRLPIVAWSSLGFMLIAFQWPFRNGGLRFATLTLAVTLIAHSCTFFVPQGWTARVEVEPGLTLYVTEPGLHFRSFRAPVRCINGQPTYELKPEPIDISVFDEPAPEETHDYGESDTIEL